MGSVIITKRWIPKVYSICIDRVDKRNAINSQLFKQLRDAFKQFDQDEEAKVAILSGSGGHFCAGYDLTEIAQESLDYRITSRNVRKMLLPIDENFPRLWCRKPVIACIEGFAAGFGFELALRCPLRVADDTAQMGFLNRRFDVPIMNGGTILLPKLLGLSRALELIMTGRAISSREALNFGLINQISDTGSAMGKATTLAQSLLKFGQQSMLNDIDSIYRLFSTQISLLQNEREQALQILNSMEQMPIIEQFLKGQVCRNGKFRLHNLSDPNPECTI